MSLSPCCYSDQRPAADAQLSLRITKLEIERRRFGYLHIWYVIASVGPSRQPQAGIYGTDIIKMIPCMISPECSTVIILLLCPIFTRLVGIAPSEKAASVNSFT